MRITKEVRLEYQVPLDDVSVLPPLDRSHMQGGN